MLQRIKSVLEVTSRRCYCYNVSKKVLQVTWRRCYNVSRASWKWLEEHVPTYQERLGNYLKKMLQRIRNVLLRTQAKERYYTPRPPPKKQIRNVQKWQLSRPSMGAPQTTTYQHTSYNYIRFFASFLKRTFAGLSPFCGLKNNGKPCRVFPYQPERCLRTSVDATDKDLGIGDLNHIKWVGF